MWVKNFLSRSKVALLHFFHPDHALIQEIANTLKLLKQEVSSKSTNAPNSADYVENIGIQLAELRSLLQTFKDDNQNRGAEPDLSDNEYVKSLQEEVARLREDTYLKLMRKYVLDSQINLYQSIARRLYDLGQEDELKKILKLQYANLYQIGVSGSSSAIGTAFDPGSMQVSMKESRYTSDKSLDNTVAYSMVPRFIWEVPAGGRGTNLLLNKEEVVLWEYTEDEEKLRQDDIRTVQASSPDASVRKNEADHRVQESGIAGYLVIQQDDEVSGVLPVNYGHNIYGTCPKTAENVYTHKINLLSEALKDEVFTIEISHDSERVMYESVADNCGINRPSNYMKSYELENGDAIIIGNISFTFIEKAVD